MNDSNKVEKVFLLLQQVTNIQIISDFLKKKNLNYSAQSWDKLYDTRLSPYLQSGEITIDDLMMLLRDVEEHGRQHVFLYECKTTKTDEFFDEGRIKDCLDKIGIADLLESPKLIDQPSTPTITDVRFETGANSKALVIKVVEQRIYDKLLEEQVLADDIFIKKYQKVKERAVNLFKLHKNGMLEVRIGSHNNSSNYSKDLENIKKIIKDSRN
ncbi:MAG: hypothetical protein ABI865_10515 [Nitrosospira sp.]